MRQIICGTSSLFHNKENRAELKPRKNEETGEMEMSNKWAFGFSFVPRKLDPQMFVDHILNGGAFTVGQFNGTTRTKDTFQASYLLAMDIDNKVMVDRLDPFTGEPCRNEHGRIIRDEAKRIEGYTTYQDVVNDPFIQQYAMLVYASPSCTNDWHKFRVVFQLSEPVTHVGYWQTLQRGLMDYCAAWYPDKSCKDAARLYFGSSNPVFTPYINLEAVLPISFAGYHFTVDMATKENALLDMPKVERSVVSDTRLEAYANKAYDNLLDEMHSGDSRHDALMSVATKMFQFEAGGWPVFSYSNIERDLYQACASNGFIEKYRVPEFHRCLNDARDYGSQSPKPRELPDRKTENDEMTNGTVDLSKSPDMPESGATPPNSIVAGKTVVNTHNGQEQAIQRPFIVKASRIALINRDRHREARKNPNAITGLPTGIPSLTRAINGFEKGTLTVILAATGMGKSTLAASFVAQLIKYGDGIIASTESSIDRFLDKIVAAMTNIPIDRIIKGTTNDYEANLLEDAYARLMQLPETALINHVSPSAKKLQDEVVRAMGDTEIKWIVVDSGSRMSAPGTNGIYDKATEIWNGLQSLALGTRLPVIVTSQLGRDVSERGHERTKNGDLSPRLERMPRLDDGYGGSIIEHNADNVLGLYRHEYYWRRGLAGLLEPDTFPAFQPGAAVLTCLKDRWNGSDGLAIPLLFTGGARYAEMGLNKKEMEHQIKPVSQDELDASLEF